jgi:hypothetical protein
MLQQRAALLIASHHLYCSIHTYTSALYALATLCTCRYLCTCSLHTYALQYIYCTHICYLTHRSVGVKFELELKEPAKVTAFKKYCELFDITDMNDMPVEFNKLVRCPKDVMAAIKAAHTLTGSDAIYDSDDSDFDSDSDTNSDTNSDADDA